MFPIPIFTICFVIFLVVLNYKIRKGYAKQDEVDEQFWERERQANTTRRQDISKLDYIFLPTSLLPKTLHTDTEAQLISLCEKKMLNLTGLSNTDLKMQYGVQNLEELTEYDDNFTTFVRLLPDYASELAAHNMTLEAQRLLEFGILDHNADSKSAYTLLANIYKEQGEEDKIQHLITVASELNSLSKGPIIGAILEVQNSMRLSNE